MGESQRKFGLSGPARLGALLGLALLLLMLAACGKPDIPPPSGPKAQTPVTALAEADSIWRAANYTRAVEMYASLLGNPGLDRTQRNLVFERYVKSALYSKQYDRALSGLEKWRTENPQAGLAWDWNNLYIQALGFTGREKLAEEHLARLMLMREAPAETREQAGIELARRYAGQGQGGRAAATLRSVYDQSPDKLGKSRLENYFHSLLGGFAEAALNQLYAEVTPANRLTFPYNLITLEKLRRESGQSSEKAAEYTKFATEMVPLLANSELGSHILGTQPEKTADTATAFEQAGGKGAVAVLLPLSGQFRQIGGKILNGIKAGQAYLARKGGGALNLKVLNTDDPGFAEAFAQLGPEYKVIGGPLNMETFKQVQGAGNVNRIFLTFMQSLGEVPEGVKAWRFFGSPRDEARALASLAGDYNIKNFGVLSPDDAYGQRMSGIFENEVQHLGGLVVAHESYPAKDGSKWSAVVKDMMRQAGQYEAIYVPDSWAQAGGIIPYFFYYNVSGLLVMGTQLWSEALSQPTLREQPFDAQHFRLAVCPGAWWPDNPSQAVKELKANLAAQNLGNPDYWVALGYDFVRFNAKLGAFGDNSGAEEVNARLSKAERMEWCVAPLSWNASGQASQAMFLFRPSVEGITPVDKEGFKERWNTIRGKPKQ